MATPRTFTRRQRLPIIQGMLAFYRTPAGQAVIEKMPLVMQNTMQAVQERMGAMMPAMQKMIAEEMEHTPPAAE